MENLETLEMQKEYLTKEQIEEIKKLDYECVWLLKEFKNGNYDFTKISDGNNGGVVVPKEKLENTIGVRKQYLYHNHPIANYSEETEKTKNIIIIAPPSSSDFMIANDNKKDIQHRIISPSGIWEFSINNSSKAKEIEQKLGTMFNYLNESNISEIDLNLKKLTLKKLNPIYLKIAESYNILINGSIDKEVLEKNIKKFSENMFKLGFNVDFKFYT